MPEPRFPDELDTDRLVLRRRHTDDADVYRQLWTERDPRVPPHRRLDAEGRPTVADITASISAECNTPGRRLLSVVRKHEGDVIGYCGLIFVGRGSPEEPELAYELARHAHGAGYATEAARALVTWVGATGHRRLWAGVRVWNDASVGVLRKLEFVETGPVEPDPAYGDSLVFSRSFPTPS